jgi:hypothetical protein
MAPSDESVERRRRIRRNVWLLVAVAVAVYVGFIAMSISRGMHMS